MTTLRALIALCLAGLCAVATAQTSAKLIPAQSEIGFTSKQMGVPVDGKFKRFDAQIAFDPKQPATGKIAFTIDLASVSMGAAEVEAELAKPGWFDSKKLASATFQSSVIKATGPAKFDVLGKLTIKGNVRDVVVPVTISQVGGTTTASGAFAIKRLDFRIGDGDWSDPSLVGDEVQVKFKLALTGIGAL